jgi:hypothetical protein
MQLAFITTNHSWNMNPVSAKTKAYANSESFTALSINNSKIPS